MSILTERHGRVVLVRLNKPAQRNVLNRQFAQALLAALTPLDQDPEVGCVVITGSDDCFCAGADIKEMYALSAQQMVDEDYFAEWEEFASLRTPKIAAVAGYALGGGCELAMMCDLIYAADNAEFAQPEIKLGVMPGIGGTQRLTHLVGKNKAMEMVLTGRRVLATEAKEIGLVANVFPAEKLLEETLSIARVIAGYSKPAAIACREAVGQTAELSLQEGVRLERSQFHTLRAGPDAQEGMQAFIEKRSASFSHR